MSAPRASSIAFGSEPALWESAKFARHEWGIERTTPSLHASIRLRIRGDLVFGGTPNAEPRGRGGARLAGHTPNCTAVAAGPGSRKRPDPPFQQLC
jgi:hypothetical protein